MKKYKIEKLEGIRLMKENDVPVLPYEFINKENFESQIKDFMKKNKIETFMVRTAGVIPKFHGTPSINHAELKKDSDKIKEFFERGFTVFIMHPSNLYRNIHSVNIMRLDDEVIVEAVGPGFTATDLNRHGNVHEEIVFDTASLEEKNSRVLVTDKSYEKKRERKIAQNDLKELEKYCSYLLEHKVYIPLSREEINYTKKMVPKLNKIAGELGFLNYVASLSFVDLGDGKNVPIFWDIYGVK